MFSLSWLNEAPPRCRSASCVRSLGARSCGARRGDSAGWVARRRAPFRLWLVGSFLAVVQGRAKCAAPVLFFCFTGQALIPTPRRAGRAFKGKYQYGFFMLTPLGFHANAFRVAYISKSTAISCSSHRIRVKGNSLLWSIPSNRNLPPQQGQSFDK